MLLLKHFKYCLLVWKFHGRQIKDKESKLHERALKIIYNDTARHWKYAA